MYASLFSTRITALPMIAFFILLFGAGFAFAAPAFDGGTGVQFNAEENATSAYAANPAKLVYYDASMAWLDFGGDWSMGTLTYSENGGKIEPGEPPDEPDEGATELKLNTAIGGRGFAAFRSGSTVFGVNAGVDWDKLSIGVSGMSLPELGYFWEGEVFSFSIPREYIGGIIAFGGKPWSFGFSGKYALASCKATEKVDEVSGVELALSNIEVLGGTAYRSGGTVFDVAAGAQILKNRLEYIDPYAEDTGSDVSGTRILGRAGYRWMAWSKGALALNADLKFTPGMKVADDEIDYDLAEGSELDVRFGPGFALYPDEKTTLAFDLNISMRRINVDTLDSEGETMTEYALGETWTYTQVGVERWLLDDFAVKAGWRQNIMVYPRNTMFAGACYKPSGSWGFNYDYAEGTIGIDKVSAFMTLNDIVNPGGHRITLSYSF